MTDPAQKDRQPRQFPAPEFPPRRPKRFARLPPAVFSPILGLLGLVLALRLAGTTLGLAPISALSDVAAGAVLVLWAFSVIALAIKNFRRPSVIVEDLRPLPGRAGYSAATMGGMAVGGILAPFAPGLALALIFASLAAHLIIGGLLLRVLMGMGPEAREVNPAWHMHLVGFIVAGTPLVILGQGELAHVILWVTMPLAAVIWGLSIAQLISRLPPAPLRPLLFLHLSPAALFSLDARALGETALSIGALALVMAMFGALVLSLRWVLAAGFTPMWGAMTFPMAAFASALMAAGGWFQIAGLALTAALTIAIPVIAWRILKLWPGGQLAAKTNAAEA
jgi:tellurite resistance protein